MLEIIFYTIKNQLYKLWKINKDLAYIDIENFFNICTPL